MCEAQETEADTVTPLSNSAHCSPHFQWCGGRRFSPAEMPIDQALFIRMEGGGRQHPRCKEVPGPLTPVSPRPPRSQHRETAVILGGCRNTQKKHAQGENRSLTLRNRGVNNQNKKRKGDSALAPLGGWRPLRWSLREQGCGDPGAPTHARIRRRPASYQSRNVFFFKRKTLLKIKKDF